jgi:acyl-CoA synthetase (AMP-forming)/AMP-acid ligase II
MQYKDGFYFTGDGAYRDKDGYYWITGRVDGACASMLHATHGSSAHATSQDSPTQRRGCRMHTPLPFMRVHLCFPRLTLTFTSSADVINVSGHRLGSAEIESALVAHPSVAEAAVIGYPHDIKGCVSCPTCAQLSCWSSVPRLRGLQG